MASTKIIEKIVVLGTGGTIAGLAECNLDNISYKAAQIGVSQLLNAVPGLALLTDNYSLISEQVAQVDSKDMSFLVWQQLTARVNFYLEDPEVKGIVITHGTDTLEETAFFLHAVLPTRQLARKPVVLTCAMRPASSVAPDGPQNLMDAAAVALTSGATGVVVVCAGTLHGALDVQKIHPYRLDAFSSGDAGPLGFVEEGVLRLVRSWPQAQVNTEVNTINNIAMVVSLPRVEIVMSYAGANGELVEALLSQNLLFKKDIAPLRGLVVATTGNGTVHSDLESSLISAQNAGIQVVLATRCCLGRILPKSSSPFPDSQGLAPVKARIALMLGLLT